MQEALKKTRKRYENMKQSPSRDVILQTVLPLFNRMDQKIDGHMEIVDANFQDVFATLNIAGEDNFIELSQALIANMATFIDRLMVDAGYFKERGEGTNEFEVSENIPDEVKQQLVSIQGQNVEWYAQYQAVLEIQALDDEEGEEEEEEEGEEGEEEEAESVPLAAASLEQVKDLATPPGATAEESAEAANA